MSIHKLLRKPLVNLLRHNKTSIVTEGPTMEYLPRSISPDVSFYSTFEFHRTLFFSFLTSPLGLDRMALLNIQLKGGDEQGE
jgi:hypothetical protein